MTAEDTGRFASHIDLYREMVDKQFTYDALRIVGYDVDLLKGVQAEFAFLAELAHAGKIAQARFISRKR